MSATQHVVPPADHEHVHITPPKLWVALELVFLDEDAETDAFRLVRKLRKQCNQPINVRENMWITPELIQEMNEILKHYPRLPQLRGLEVTRWIEQAFRFAWPSE